MFPAARARRPARESLDLEADEIDGGHYITLSRPPSRRSLRLASATSAGGGHDEGERERATREGVDRT